MGIPIPRYCAVHVGGEKSGTFVEGSTTAIQQF